MQKLKIFIYERACKCSEGLLMLSYQHSYHAGCFADIIKHFTLSRLCNYLIQKDKPIFYLETHSGRGVYDLKNQQSIKTGEAKQGIELLWNQKHQLPKIFSSYLENISYVNQENKLRFYPGSPAIAVQSLRPQDRIFLAELHPGEFEYLQHLPHQNKRVHFSHSNGYEALNALLPPPERRGLIFIDPSYEIKTEYRQVTEYLKKAYLRFETGVYCLWYPLIDNRLHSQLLRGLDKIDAKHLRVEFYLNDTNKAGMQGCGLWIINPPYTLEAELKLALNTLREVFNAGHSSYLLNSS